MRPVGAGGSFPPTPQLLLPQNPIPGEVEVAAPGRKIGINVEFRPQAGIKYLTNNRLFYNSVK
jgi:hypothetical protein